MVGFAALLLTEGIWKYYSMLVTMVAHGIEKHALMHLKYAHDGGCPWIEGACNWAAEGGHLEVLQYLHENGCPWKVYSCAAAAARNGHLDILGYVLVQWLSGEARA